jgi:hypothetical protein
MCLHLCSLVGYSQAAASPHIAPPHFIQTFLFYEGFFVWLCPVCSNQKLRRSFFVNESPPVAPTASLIVTTTGVITITQSHGDLNPLHNTKITNLLYFIHFPWLSHAKLSPAPQTSPLTKQPNPCHFNHPANRVLRSAAPTPAQLHRTSPGRERTTRRLLD